MVARAVVVLEHFNENLRGRPRALMARMFATSATGAQNTILEAFRATRVVQLTTVRDQKVADLTVLNADIVALVAGLVQRDALMEAYFRFRFAHPKDSLAAADFINATATTQDTSMIAWRDVNLASLQAQSTALTTLITALNTQITDWGSIV